MADDSELNALVDVNAESCVLGSMIESPDVAQEIISLVSRTDFSSPKHQELFDVLRSRVLRSEPVDSVSISIALAEIPGPIKQPDPYRRVNGYRQPSMLEWLGGAAFIHELTSSVPTVANAAFYARTLVHKAFRRRVREVGWRIAHMAVEADESLDSNMLLNRVMRETELLTPKSAKSASTVDSIRDVLGELKNGFHGMSIHTGFTDLDKMLGPIREGRLVVVAGRPGQGKSVWATDVARYVTSALNLRCLYVTLEMSTGEILMRNLSAMTGIHFEKLRDGRLTESEIVELEIKAARLEGLPLDFLDRPVSSIDDIDSQCRSLDRSGKSPSVIVIDYLQLIQPDSKYINRQEQVADLSRRLKILARERHCVVILLAQLNRGPEQRIDKRPQLSDLRESGSIEQDADYVILIHRPGYYDKNDARAGEGDFIVAKHRHGATGTVAVASQLHCMRFANLAMSR